MVYKYVGCTSRSAVRHDGNQVKDLKAGNGQHNAYENVVGVSIGSVIFLNR